MTTRRIWYIAGRFRHYLADGTYDLDKMKQEVANEAYWATVVAHAGHRWHSPLAVTTSAELSGVLKGEEVAQVDMEFLEDLRSGYDGVILRPGWRGHDGLLESKGTRAEFLRAQQLGLLVIEPTSQDLYGATISVLQQLGDLTPTSHERRTIGSFVKSCESWWLQEQGISYE